MSNKTPQDLTSQQVVVLKAFARALGQEAHVLTRRPDLLWQQLHNSLSPLNISNLASLLEKEAEQRRSQPWLKRRGGAGASPMQVLASLSSGVECCDWSSVSGLLGIGCHDGSVYVLDPSTGDVVTFGTHDGPVSCCRFSPDGSFLISGSKDATLSVYDVVARELCGIFRGHQSPVTCLVILPNGRHVVSGSQDRTLLIWDRETMEPIKTLRGHDRGVLCSSLSVDGSRLASGDSGGRLVLWDMFSLEPLLSFIAHEDAVLCCALNHSGEILATGAADGSARIWRLNDIHSPTELEGHTDEVSGCAFVSHDRLVTIGADQTIRAWTVSTGSSVAAASGGKGPLTCLSMQSDGRIAFTGAANGTVLAWRVDDLGYEIAPTGHNAAVTGVVVAPEGYAATASLDGNAIIWRISDGSILHRLQCDEPLVGCALCQGGATLITAGSRKQLVEWDIATGTQLKSIPLKRDVVLGCASDPMGGPLALGTVAGLTVREFDGSLWRLNLQIESDDEADQERLRKELQSQNLSMGMKSMILKVLQERNEMAMLINNASAHCVAVQPGGRLAAVGDVTGRVMLIDLPTRSIIHILSAPIANPIVSTTSVALAQNSKLLAAGYSNGIVTVYSLEDGENIQWSECGGILGCTFSGDSQLLAVGTEGNYLAIWKWRERIEIYHLPTGHAVRACAFSADDAALVCADAAGNVYIVEMIGLKSVIQ